MEISALIEAFRLWLEAQEIEDVEIEEGVGPDNTITTISFPVDEEEGYPAYDIIASLSEDDSIYFCGEYCELPDADEDELLQFVNDLNVFSPITLTLEDGMLCFSYSVPVKLVADAEQLASIFFFIWDAIDSMRGAIGAAFGIGDEYADAEELEEELEEESLDEELDEELDSEELPEEE